MTEDGPLLEPPRCPTCRKPVAGEPATCPGCRTAYHPDCLSEGCLVAGCTGRPAAEDVQPIEPSSPLWRFVRWAWPVGIALTVMIVASASSGSHLVPILAALPIWVAFALTGAAFAHDLVVLPSRRDRWGTLAFAALFIGLSLAPLTAPVGERAAGFIALLGVAEFVLLTVAGRCIDRDVARSRRGIELLIVVGIIGVLAAIAMPNFKSTRSHSPTRSCYANQKTVAGALEMYNLDKNTKVTVFDDSVWQVLKSGGYLQSIPQDPGGGVGSSSHYRWTPGGNFIRCEKHGTIQ